MKRQKKKLSEIRKIEGVCLVALLVIIIAAGFLFIQTDEIVPGGYGTSSYDTAAAPPGPTYGFCGDGSCGGGETVESCPQDCASESFVNAPPQFFATSIDGGHMFESVVLGGTQTVMVSYKSLGGRTLYDATCVLEYEGEDSVMKYNSDSNYFEFSWNPTTIGIIDYGITCGFKVVGSGDIIAYDVGRIKGEFFVNPPMVFTTGEAQVTSAPPRPEPIGFLEFLWTKLFGG